MKIKIAVWALSLIGLAYLSGCGKYKKFVGTYDGHVDSVGVLMPDTFVVEAGGTQTQVKIIDMRLDAAYDAFVEGDNLQHLGGGGITYNSSYTGYGNLSGNNLYITLTGTTKNNGTVYTYNLKFIGVGR